MAPSPVSDDSEPADTGLASSTPHADTTRTRSAALARMLMQRTLPDLDQTAERPGRVVRISELVGLDPEGVLERNEQVVVRSARELEVPPQAEGILSAEQDARHPGVTVVRRFADFSSEQHDGRVEQRVISFRRGCKLPEQVRELLHVPVEDRPVLFGAREVLIVVMVLREPQPGEIGA